ncbi:hypothetical protein R1sor_008731 [Riccia sorocarpa]|uniref:HTH CENPB-type domain-containing protein n=1 Tax=Riccia sorocarpa TaxID=122646 RepID=A0ABD3HXV3_9MARC
MVRTELTNAERNEICKFHGEAPGITNKTVSAWVTERFGKPVNEMMISRIMRRKEQFMGASVALGAKRTRRPDAPNLEMILFAWFSTMQEQKVTITDDMICEKARFFQNSVPQEGRKEMKFSHGWLQGFKKRHGIKSFVCHGEAASVDITPAVRERIDALRVIISRYLPDFNLAVEGAVYADGTRELQAALDQLEEIQAESGFILNMTAEEFTDFEQANDTSYPLTAEELVEFYTLPECETEVTEETDDTDQLSAPLISFQDAIRASETLGLYLEQAAVDTTADSIQARKLQASIETIHSSRQILKL